MSDQITFSTEISEEALYKLSQQGYLGPNQQDMANASLFKTFKPKGIHSLMNESSSNNSSPLSSQYNYGLTSSASVMSSRATSKSSEGGIFGDNGEQICYADLLAPGPVGSNYFRGMKSDRPKYYFHILSYLC